MMEWGSPINFVWLWVLPAALAVFILSSWRKKSAMRRFGDPELVEKLVLSYEPWKRWFKRILILGSFLCMVLALCQPHFRTREITVERKGVDVMIAVDVSRSMLAKDIAPTRLDKAKLELTTLIEKLKQDRIGVVAFAGEAFIQCPLTLDKGAVKLFLTTLSPNLIPTPGTALGAAIRVSLAAFGEKDKKDKDNKVIILLTDGEDHDSDPKRAAKMAKEQNARIFTIGIGTQDGSTLPSEEPREGVKRDLRGQVVLSKLDEKLLKEIAQETGGTYYRASRGEIEIENIALAIRQMGQKGFQKDKIIEYDENFQMFLLPALILLLFEMILSERKTKINWFSRRNAAVWLIFMAPFLVGFNFFSAVKNEEGNTLYKKGQLGKAKSVYQSALKGEPSSPEIAFNLGNAYYKEGSFKDAVRSYAQAAKAERNRTLQPQAFYNLGNGYFKDNELDKAAQYYKEALRLNPYDEDAKYNLELVLKKQQQDKKDDKKDQKKQDKQQNQQNKDDKKDQKGGQGSQGQQGGNSSKDNKDNKDNKDQNQKGGQGQKDQDQKDKDDQNSAGQGGQQDKQDKQDQKDQEGQQGEQNKQDQSDKQDKQDQQGQENQQGQQGQEDQKDQQNQKGEEDKQDKGNQQGEEGQQGQQDQQNQQDQQDQKGRQGEESKQPQGGNQDQRDQQQQEEQSGGAGGQQQQEKEKTPEQVRAEQLLGALEGQEQQVMREQGSRQGRIPQNKRYVDKDW